MAQYACGYAAHCPPFIAFALIACCAYQKQQQQQQNQQQNPTTTTTSGRQNVIPKSWIRFIQSPLLTADKSKALTAFFYELTLLSLIYKGIKCTFKKKIVH